MALPQQNATYTYRDYLTWPDDERVELIDGVIYNMTPAPSRQHQGVCGELVRQLGNALLDGPCRVYAAPFDVRLPDEGDQADEARTVVQPDVVVVCDVGKLDDRGCLGAPDLVVEILSPSTAAKDQIQKLRLYERHGVRGDWIIHPTDEILYVRVLGPDGTFGVPDVYPAEGTFTSAVIDGVTLDLERLFRP
jgi:Uma2 family endonuclease